MTTINIKDFIDKYNDFALAGNAVFCQAKDAIVQNEIVNFNLLGQESISTVFLNTTLGRLIDELGTEQVKKFVRFSNLLRSQAERIQKYFNDYSEIA